MPNDADTKPTSRLIEVVLDDASIGRNTPDVEHERQVAIYDLLEYNEFELVNGPAGPYKLELAIVEQRLVFNIKPVDETLSPVAFILSLSQLRPVVKDYFMVCENYFEAIKSAPPQRIEALDMGRRALHDEGSKILTERLDGKVRLDHPTSRRLFTLICALHWKG